ncbi:hypothetical protein EGT07_03305 [Herbaspirillum sp. HC18]|nr:hypothetical protein EGT07_03305 [Herbaspirillum sp. HC18]
MVQQEGNRNVTLDDLLKLVETAATTIERLQAENAALSHQLRECEASAQGAIADAQEKAARIEALEQTEAALRLDAEWSRWFRNKYKTSTFLSHIERDFRIDYLGEQVPDVDGTPSSPPQGDPHRDAS